MNKLGWAGCQGEQDDRWEGNERPRQKCASCVSRQIAERKGKDEGRGEEEGRWSEENVGRGRRGIWGKRLTKLAGEETC